MVLSLPARRRYLFISNPATGQINPLLAVMEELALRGNQAVLASSESVYHKFQKLQARMGYTVQSESTPSEEYLKRCPLVFISLGSCDVMDDYTNKAVALTDQFHDLCRSNPGDIWGWLSTFIELVPGASTEYRDIVFRIRDLCEKLDADMLLVDNFSPFAVDAARLTKRPFIETSPGASSAVASNVSFLTNPLPMSGGRKAGTSIFTLFRNLVFMFIWFKFIFFNPWPIRRRRFRREVLGLKPVDVICDSVMTPTPGMLPQQIATITFNVASMDIYPTDAYDKSVYFVGPCFSTKGGMIPSTRAPSSPVFASRRAALESGSNTPSSPSVSLTPSRLEKEMRNVQATSDDAVKTWMDQAMSDGKRVLYINMGSIFFYSRQDYDNIVEALKMLHELAPNALVLWKVPKLPYDVQPIPSLEEANLPPYIRRENWIPDVEVVLQHPALAVFMHHGGGNSYNEAIAHGIPQFCVSQWVDTHDIGLYVQHSGVGLWAEKSPRFDPVDMSTKLAKLVNDEHNTFQHVALSWQLKAAQAGGTVGACDIIESLVTSYKFEGGSSKAPMPSAL